MNKIIEIKQTDAFVLSLTFNDGETKIIDFEPLIGEGISAKLLEKEYFSMFSIDEGGGIEWPNGMDFCPNYLKDFIPTHEFETAAISKNTI